MSVEQKSTSYAAFELSAKALFLRIICKSTTMMMNTWCTLMVRSQMCCYET
jgi:hypothetical protein